MELSGCNIKKYLIFSYISKNGTLHFSAQVRKIKKIHPEKKFLIFQEIQLFSSNIFIFPQKKLFRFTRKWNPALFSSSSKTKKIPSISRNGFSWI